MRQWLRNRIVALLDNFLGVGVMGAAAALLPLPLITRAAVVVGLLLGLYLLTEVESLRLLLGSLRHACGQLLFRVKIVPVRPAEEITRPLTVSVDGLLGRNDPCWCGSGKKYKQCHGA
jgi:hypothetical protein